MLQENEILKAIDIINKYCPSLIQIITERKFRDWLLDAYDHTQIGPIEGTKNMNFIASFFELIKAHASGLNSIVIQEFKYFDFLLNKFNNKYPNSKPFKNLILSAIHKFETDASFLEVLSEVGVCLAMSSDYKLVKYEHKLSNNKQIDLLFSYQDEENILIEVLSIHFDSDKFEGEEELKKFLDYRLRKKYEDKTNRLNDSEKSKIFIAPVISGMKNQIIKQCKGVLKGIVDSEEYKAYEPRFFGNIQGTYFSLFTVDQVVQLPSPDGE